LQLSEQNNWRVSYPSTPASYFHLLREQIYSSHRKPLIVFTPKSLLRNRLSFSSLEEFSQNFSPVLCTNGNPSDVSRIVMCTGKVFYDLEKARSNLPELSTLKLIRLEQLYPFPEKEIMEILTQHNDVKEWIWCQEEPQNMGAWFYVEPYMRQLFLNCGVEATINYVGRIASSSPATGYTYCHQKQQDEFTQHALRGFL
jgi:2-oxoglutarate dehydrogenase E1 component